MGTVLSGSRGLHRLFAPRHLESDPSRKARCPELRPVARHLPEVGQDLSRRTKGAGEADGVRSECGRGYRGCEDGVRGQILRGAKRVRVRLARSDPKLGWGVTGFASLRLALYWMRPQLSLSVDMTGLLSRAMCVVRFGDGGTTWVRGSIDG